MISIFLYAIHPKWGKSAMEKRIIAAKLKIEYPLMNVPKSLLKKKRIETGRLIPLLAKTIKVLWYLRWNSNTPVLFMFPERGWIASWETQNTIDRCPSLLCPGKCGLNEQVNGLIWQYFPKKQTCRWWQNSNYILCKQELINGQKNYLILNHRLK